MSMRKLFPTFTIITSILCCFQLAQADFLGGLSKKLSEASDAIVDSSNKVVKDIKDVGQNIGVIEKSESVEPLPGGVTSRIRKMYKELDKVDSKLTKGAGSATDRANRAQMDLKRAHKYMDEIEKRYNGKYSPEHPEMVAANTRLEKAQNSFDAAMSGALQHDATIAAEEKRQQEAAAAELTLLDQERQDAEAAEKGAKEQSDALCKNWDDKLSPYAYGDKAIGSGRTTNQQLVAEWRKNAGEAQQLLANYPAGKCPSVDPIADIVTTKVAEFTASDRQIQAQQQQFATDKGEIVFSTTPINGSGSNPGQKTFQAGDNIYGLIRVVKPWSEIYRKDNNFDIRINAKIDGKVIHAQFIKIKDPSYANKNYLVFNVAPEPKNLVAYSDPRIEYGKTSASIIQGPNELTHHLSKLSPGTHTMSFDVYYYGKTWATGEFTVSGSDYSTYESLHNIIAGGVVAGRTLPKAQMHNKGLEEEMKELLKDAGWEDVYRLNIVDKDWWIERTNGGNTPVKAKYLAAAALTKKSDGTYAYKRCTFHQDKLITGGFSKLYLSHQGDEVSILPENIDK